MFKISKLLVMNTPHIHFIQIKSHFVHCKLYISLMKDVKDWK